MSAEVQIVYNADSEYYAVIGIRETGIWLSVAKHPLPVPREWRRPGALMACLIRGRDYYRVCTINPQNDTPPKFISADDDLVKDYRDAVWWSPGLEELHAEIQGLNEALCEATKPKRVETIPQGKPTRG